jgi:hypothetical protein
MSLLSRDMRLSPVNILASNICTDPDYYCCGAGASSFLLAGVKSEAALYCYINFRIFHYKSLGKRVGAEAGAAQLYLPRDGTVS